MDGTVASCGSWEFLGDKEAEGGGVSEVQS